MCELKDILAVLGAVGRSAESDRVGVDFVGERDLVVLLGGQEELLDVLDGVGAVVDGSGRLPGLLPPEAILEGDGEGEDPLLHKVIVAEEDEKEPGGDHGEEGAEEHPPGGKDDGRVISSEVGVVVVQVVEGGHGRTGGHCGRRRRRRVKKRRGRKGRLWRRWTVSVS